MTEKSYLATACWHKEGFGYDISLEEISERFHSGVSLRVLDRVKDACGVRGPGDGLEIKFSVSAASSLEAIVAACHWLAYSEITEIIPTDASLSFEVIEANG
jgi:hypothetical protein